MIDAKYIIECYYQHDVTKYSYELVNIAKHKLIY